MQGQREEGTGHGAGDPSAAPPQSRPLTAASAPAGPPTLKPMQDARHLGPGPGCIPKKPKVCGARPLQPGTKRGMAFGLKIGDGGPQTADVSAGFRGGLRFDNLSNSQEIDPVGSSNVKSPSNFVSGSGAGTYPLVFSLACSFFLLLLGWFGDGPKIQKQFFRRCPPVFADGFRICFFMTSKLSSIFFSFTFMHVLELQSLRPLKADTTLGFIVHCAQLFRFFCHSQKR